MKLLIFLISAAVTINAHAKKLSLDDKIEIAKARCIPRVANEAYFRMDMYKNNASMEELTASYELTYNQKERLYSRAGYNESEKAFITTNGKQSVILPEHFIKSTILHIEKALKLNYVQYVFFPDMGHSHVQIPQDYYDKHFKGENLGRPPAPLTHYLTAPGIKSLYHTAEKLKTTDDNHQAFEDRHLQWRFHTRNLLADSAGNIDILTNSKSYANTVNTVPNHRWNYGISLSANKNGCFPFEDATGQIQYFDISAWDPPYDCVNNFCGQKKLNIF